MCSGVSALVYQVAWVKMLSLSFGNTSAAAAAVIGSIMAGMGLGAALYHKIERRFPKAFALYGLIEIGIAVSAAAISSGLYRLPGLYVELATLAPQPWRLSTLRFASVFVILAVPSALMGATFPALCRAVIRSKQGLELSLGPIYGLNTVGAGVGALLAGFILIETFGNLRSIWLANIVNLLVGAGALVLATRERPWVSDLVESDAESGPAVRHTLPRGAIMAALVVSGFATMAYEILWMRAARYLIGNGTYALSSVLAIFLFGLGLGALAHRRIIRRRRPDADLVLCQIGISVFALLAMWLESSVLTSKWTWEGLSVFAPAAVGSSWIGLLLKGALVTGGILLPPTLMMGLSFPLASSMFAGEIRLLGRNLGGAYLLANLGSIAGVIAGATVILPTFGTIGGTKAVAVLNLLLAIALSILLWRSRGLPRRGLYVTGIVASLILILVLPSRMAFRGEIEASSGSTLRFWKEGDLATVKVHDHPEWNVRAMTIDGYIIGVNPPYGRTVAQKELLLAHLPMALNPDSRVTLNLGLGSATTLAMLGNYRRVDSLDCVEISSAVVEGARLFSEAAVLSDPRTRIFVDDAVHFLQRTGVAYDIIISDAKQNPRFPGNATILSAEFFEICKSRLAPDGMVVQWIPMGLQPTVFDLVVRTFASVFPDVAVFYYPPECVLMTGQSRVSGRPHALPPPVRFPGLEKYGIHNSIQLLAGQICDEQGLAEALPPGPINTWDHPLFEFLPYRLFEPHYTAEYVGRNLDFLLQARAHSGGRMRFDSSPEFTAMRAAHDRIANGFAETIRSGEAKVILRFLDEALALDSSNVLARDLKGILETRDFWEYFDSPGR